MYLDLVAVPTAWFNFLLINRGKAYREIEMKINDYEGPWFIQDITVEATDLKDKVLVKVINNGNIPAEFVRGTEVFFGGNKVLGYNTQYFCDSELKPRASMTD